MALRQDLGASRKIITRAMADQGPGTLQIGVHSNENYGSGASAWQVASLAIAAPVGSTRIVASSTAQKLRTPVWLNVTGTPAA